MTDLRWPASETAVSPGAERPVAAYESVPFARASEFVQARAGTRAGAPSRRPWFLDVRGAFALLRLVRAEPTLDVALTDSVTGRRLRTDMGGRTWGVPRNRLCVAVLAVPRDVAERPSGNRNRALRAALNTAARAGITVRDVEDPDERARIAEEATRSSPRLGSWSTSAAQHPEERWWAADDADGGLAGIAVAVVDAEWAELVTLIGVGEARRSSAARFLLHHAVTRVLAARNVGHLAVLDDSPLLVGAGTRHLQRVLGYQLVRLRRPRRPSAGPLLSTTVEFEPDGLAPR